MRGNKGQSPIQYATIILVIVALVGSWMAYSKAGTAKGATKKDVSSLEDRIGTLEKRIKSLEKRVSSIGKKVGVKTAKITVQSIDIPSKVKAGEEATIRAIVKNRGEKKGSKTIELKVAGEVRDRRKATLKPGETTDIDLKATMEEAGSYDIRVGTQVGTLSVGKPYAGVTLNVITYAGPESEILTKHLYKPFEKKTGINVKVHAYDEPTMRDKEIMDFKAETGKYDVVRLQHWHAAKYFQKGWLLPLDNFIEQSDINMNNYPEGGLEMFEYNGHQYSIPDTILTNIMIYRKDIFNQQGWDVPQTVDEYLKTLDKFKNLKQEEGTYGEMNGTWVRGAKSFPTFGGLAGWVYAYGGQFLTDNHHANVDSETNIKAVKDWVHMAKNHGPKGQATLSWVKGGELYAKGQVLMQSEVSGFINYVQNPDKSKVVGKNGFSTSPVYEPTGRHIQWSFATGLAINDDSSHKEAAWKFIKWRNSAEAYRIEIENNIRVDMPFKPAYHWDIHQELAKEWNVAPAMETLRNAHEYASFEYWPRIPEFTEVATAICSHVSKAIAGDVTVEKALHNAQEEVKSILQEAGYYE